MPNIKELRNCPLDPLTLPFTALYAALAADDGAETASDDGPFSTAQDGPHGEAATAHADAKACIIA